MSVSTQSKEYADNVDLWKKSRDAVNGATAVKAKGAKYLPKPNPEDSSAENTARYDDYVARANYVNFTGATLDGMLGMVFRKEQAVDLQGEIAYMEENANGAGLTLEQMARSLISNMLQAGRHGLLTEYPEAPKREDGTALTKAEVVKLGLQANIKAYPAERVINWRTVVVGGIEKLSLVVLEEDHEEVSDDGFESETKTYHRVLKLVDGLYEQTLYNENEEIIVEFEPKDAKGQRWTEIPFIFAGAENNDPDVDRAPLYDIAEVNIAHYRNSADFEESCYMVGQPTPYAAGLTQTWVDANMKNGVVIGSRRFLNLPVDGSAGLLQAAPNSMPEAGMTAKELQMVKLGARLITDASGTETAEAARIRYAGQNSKLAAVVGNAEAALKQCFEWAMQFMGGAGENEYVLNREFYDKTADPQMVIAKIQLLDRGVIAMRDMRDGLRSTGVIESDRTDEEIEAEAEVETEDL